MNDTLPREITIGEIARRTQKPIHCIQYVIRTRNIRPMKRAGNVRIFSDADATYIASELRRIDADRGGL